MTIKNDKSGEEPDLDYIFDDTYRCAWYNETHDFMEIYPQDSLMSVHESY